MDLSGKSSPCRRDDLAEDEGMGMGQPPDADLIELGRKLARVRRRARRLRTSKAGDWAAWSAAMEDTTTVARRIGRVQPDDLPGLLVRYQALHWLLLEQDDGIMDDEGRRAFLAFGRALTKWGTADDLPRR